jgi:RimJ/RimL family protein N-acetyltransferase
VQVPTLPIELNTKSGAAITLRAFTDGDFEQFCAYRCLPEVARYVPWPPDDRHDARIALTKRIKNRSLEHPGDLLTPAIIDAASGALVGEVMLAWDANEHRQGEVGFALHPDHHGLGFAYAAAAAMLRIGFAGIGLHRIRGACDPRNVPSAGLLTRLGMRQEAHLREFEFSKGEWCDELVFGLLATEWSAAQPAP